MVLIRPLEASDREAWNTLWTGYLTFYKTTLPPEQFDLTWARLHDPAEPMYVLGAFEGEEMLGIVHYIFHRTCWSAGPTCYLQDLFRSSRAWQGRWASADRGGVRRGEDRRREPRVLANARDQRDGDGSVQQGRRAQRLSGLSNVDVTA